MSPPSFQAHTHQMSQSARILSRYYQNKSLALVAHSFTIIYHLHAFRSIILTFDETHSSPRRFPNNITLQSQSFVPRLGNYVLREIRWGNSVEECLGLT